ncbi:MAG: ribonuclease P protein component [Candidatus Saccharimonadales bacterium]
MIRRANRFHGYGSLRYVYKNGKTVRGPLMSLRYCPNSKRIDYRLAVVVSKKVNKSAVARNRMRRRIYEEFRRQLKADQAFDLVLTVFQPQLQDAPAEEVHQQVAQLIDQSGLAKQ